MASRAKRANRRPYPTIPHWNPGCVFTGRWGILQVLDGDVAVTIIGDGQGITIRHSPFGTFRILDYNGFLRYIQGNKYDGESIEFIWDGDCLGDEVCGRGVLVQDVYDEDRAWGYITVGSQSQHEFEAIRVRRPRARIV